MATSKDFADFVAGQLENAGSITYKKMFGEYGLYADGKIIALLCDNQLFIKPTEAGKHYIGTVTEAPPYSGAKMYYLIDDKLDDREWLCGLVRVMLPELPEPKPKKKKTK